MNPEVEHDLFQVRCADLDPLDVVVERQRDRDGRTEHPLEGAGGAGGHGVDVDDVARPAVATTQVAQRLGEPCGTQRGAAYLVGVLDTRARRVEACDQQLGVSGDGRQQIVEVVRDVTGQPAAGLEFPGALGALAKPLLARAERSARGPRLPQRDECHRNCHQREGAEHRNRDQRRHHPLMAGGRRAAVGRSPEARPPPPGPRRRRRRRSDPSRRASPGTTHCPPARSCR